MTNGKNVYSRLTYDLGKKKISKDDKNISLFYLQYVPKTCPGKNIDLVFMKSLVSPNAIKEVNKPQNNNKEELIKFLRQALVLAERL